VPHFYYKSLHFFATTQWFKHFVFIQYTPMLVIYYHFITNVGLLADDDVYFIAGVILRRGFMQVAVELAGGHNAVAVIHIAIQQVLLPLFQRNLLFTKRYQ